MAAPKNIHHAKCEICGATVEYSKRRRRFCKSCSEIVSKCYQKVRHCQGDKSAVAVDLAKTIVESGSDSEPDAGHAETKAEQVRCKFCGKYTTKQSGFCRDCIRDGFDHVYAIRHRSNGWDRRS